jgi:hypothetical protein
MCIQVLREAEVSIRIDHPNVIATVSTHATSQAVLGTM